MRTRACSPGSRTTISASRCPTTPGGEARRYRPDFILKIDDGHRAQDGSADPLNLVVEIKGFRNEDAKDKAETMRTYWVPGVNNLGTMGRWAFAEFTEKWTMQSEFERVISEWIDGVTCNANQAN